MPKFYPFSFHEDDIELKIHKAVTCALFIKYTDAYKEQSRKYRELIDKASTDILNFWKDFYKYNYGYRQDYHSINIYQKYNVKENINVLFNFVKQYKCKNEIIILSDKVMLYICEKKGGIINAYDRGKQSYTNYLTEIFDNYLNHLDNIVHSTITKTVDMHLVTKEDVNIYLSSIASKFNSSIKYYCAEHNNDEYNLCVKYLRTVNAIYDNIENAIFIKDDNHIFMKVTYDKNEDEYFVKSDKSIVYFTINLMEENNQNDKILTHHSYKYDIDIKNKNELFNRIIYKFEDHVNDIINSEI